MTDKMEKLAYALAREGLNNNLSVEIIVRPLVIQELGDAEVQETEKSLQQDVKTCDPCPLTPRK